MPCPICDKKVHILPNRDEEEYVITNKGVVHLRCYIMNKPEDMFVLTKMSREYLRDRLKAHKTSIEI